MAKNLSVRETEAIVKKASQPQPEKAAVEKDVHTRAAEERLRFVLGTRVRISRTRKGGAIEIDFTSEDELNRIYEFLTGSNP
jgi:ParB family transcriptional regulator, chromosome partitioning protein